VSNEKQQDRWILWLLSMVVRRRLRSDEVTSGIRPHTTNAAAESEHLSDLG
jgi:hypothetical protein